MVDVDQMLYASSTANEGNAAGKAFEKSTCDNIANVLKDFPYIKAITIDQLLNSSQNEIAKLEGREEDYPDICIVNTKNGKMLFVECKEGLKSNVANLKFIINEDSTIQFVAGKSQNAISLTGLIARLAEELQASSSWKEFNEFLHVKNNLLDNAKPIEVLIGAKHTSQELVSKLAQEVNSRKDDYSTSANLIPNGTFAPTTLPVWATALVWKLSEFNSTHTYDICSIDIDYMSELMKDHYASQKKLPAYYIQIADDLFQFRENSNPLRLFDIDGNQPMAFPNLKGRYTLKFAPRLSNPNSLKIYFDTRSYFIEEIPQSNLSFNAISSSRIPKIDLH